MNADEMRDIFNNMPEDVQEPISIFAAIMMDVMVGTNSARAHYREKVRNNPQALKAFDCACKRYDLNVVVVQTLGNIKAMLENFDANDFSTSHLVDNMKLHKNISTVWALSIQSINDKLGELNKMEEEFNETGDGNASG